MNASLQSSSQKSASEMRSLVLADAVTLEYSRRLLSL